MNRLRELDFLRGAAILLVLLRHQYLFAFTKNMGWIGVDLFFVLSGFLVSGLLFKEYQKFGDIHPTRFLIRRGFKIYPIYYLFYLPYILPKILQNDLNVTGLAGDLTFTQNYVWGWGYAYSASWSLAVEEHFYFGLAIALWYYLGNLKKRTLQHTGSETLPGFEKAIIAVLITVFCLRIVSNYVFPAAEVRNTSMTHLRIDSLLAGVLVSYLYYFKREQFGQWFRRHKIILYIICIAGLCWTPFIEPITSVFVKTAGFSLLYISFAIVLMYFLFKENINKKLDGLLTAPVVNAVSKIGYCSYSIYIIHMFVNKWYAVALNKLGGFSNVYVNFVATSLASIMLGILMTNVIERYFLKLRNRYFPGRV
jgi:peptidoglycan/LPS O-acetylase OafA/YrhL